MNSIFVFAAIGAVAAIMGVAAVAPALADAHKSWYCHWQDDTQTFKVLKGHTDKSGHLDHEDDWGPFDIDDPPTVDDCFDLRDGGD